ncbi:MAG: hypothetical protein EOP21_03925 [Hyphomicrobiales bacterium]|nr:MAG: hypothetical protein EOP21_03925 [Hyphomicrobiales bacterium]
MIVAGGTYGERCHYPHWDQIYGSGLRAAIALADVSPGTTLHSYVSSVWWDDVEATLSSLGLKGALQRTDDPPISFAYLHSLDRMGPFPEDRQSQKPLEVEGDVILRFGMIEGNAKVTGDRVVFDPQSSAAAFKLNGSTSRSLVHIATQAEIIDFARSENRPEREYMTFEQRLREGVIELKEISPKPTMVLVKDNLGGLSLYRGDEPDIIPTYAAESYFRIGSGDVIAAAFAHAWGELKMDPVAAADYAARCAAFFVEGPRLPLPTPASLDDRKTITQRSEPLRIVGIGDFELQHLVRATENWLQMLGKTGVYRSLDINDELVEAEDMILVGTQTTRRQIEAIAETIAQPIVVFWPGVGISQARDLFPKSIVVDDYATALYHAMRRQ